MKRTKAVLLTLAGGGLLLAVLLMLSAWTATYPRPAPQALRPGVWRGVFHVHSQASDGQGTLHDIARAASAVGRSFVIVTDHNLEELPAPHLAENTLLIHAVELSTPNGHVVALGTLRGLSAEQRREQPLHTVQTLGGVSVLAHPVQWKNPWKDWDTAQLADGLELYSADSFFRDALIQPVTRLIPALLAYPFHSGHALMSLVNDPREARQRLLGLTKASPRISLCAVDAHGRPPYEHVFAAMALYVPEPPPSFTAEEKKSAVFASIKDGAAYCVFELLGDGQGFATVPSRRVYHVGDKLQVQLPPVLPLPTQIRVYGSGALDADGRRVHLTSPGAVQIEVWALAPGRLFQREWKPWLIASPFQVLPRIEPASTPE